MIENYNVTAAEHVIPSSGHLRADFASFSRRLLELLT